MLSSVFPDTVLYLGLEIKNYPYAISTLGLSDNIMIYAITHLVYRNKKILKVYKLFCHWCDKKLPSNRITLNNMES